MLLRLGIEEQREIEVVPLILPLLPMLKRIGGPALDETTTS